MRDKIAFALLFIIIAFCVYGFFTFYERYEEEENIGYSLKAKQNPYLAAEYFLEKNNVDVSSDISSLDFSRIGSDSTLFITDVNSVLLTTAKIDDAIDWVSEGGFLIVGVNSEDELSDSLLQRFDLQLFENDIGENTDPLGFPDDEPAKLSEILREQNKNAQEGIEDNENVNNESGENKTDLNSFISGLGYSEPTSAVEVSFDNVDDILNVYFPDYMSLDFTYYADNNHDLYTAGNGFGIHLVQANVGEGVITFLSHSTIWTSRNIGAGDNAYLLALLADESSPFHIIYDIRRENLWQLIKKFAFETIIICSLLLFAWLWYKAVRTGRILAPPSPDRRAFTDHIMAVSEFHMAEKNQQLLIDAVKEGLFEALRKRDHQFEKYDIKTQASLIASWCQLNEQNVHNCLEFFNQANTNQIAFIQQMQMANTIRKQL